MQEGKAHVEPFPRVDPEEMFKNVYQSGGFFGTVTHNKTDDEIRGGALWQ